MQKTITVPVRLDDATFRRFARFDAFGLRKRLRRPAIFFSIFLALSLVAFLSGREQSALLGRVLLAVGLLFPAVYIGSFLSDIRRQAKKAGLRSRPFVYTVRLDQDGVHVTNARKEEAPLRLPWENVAQAFRMKGCVYLYVTPAKAFLLPDGQADAPDGEVWSFLIRHMGAGKCRMRVGS